MAGLDERPLRALRTRRPGTGASEVDLHLVRRVLPAAWRGRTEARNAFACRAVKSFFATPGAARTAAAAAGSRFGFADEPVPRGVRPRVASALVSTRLVPHGCSGATGRQRRFLPCARSCKPHKASPTPLKPRVDRRVRQTSGRTDEVLDGQNDLVGAGHGGNVPTQGIVMSLAPGTSLLSSLPKKNGTMRSVVPCITRVGTVILRARTR
jgi:hypothetical protein